MAVAIPVNAAFDNITGQHLHHANFTGPRAGGGHGIKIATFEQFKCGKDLGLKQFGSPAIMRQRDQRVECIKIALNRTKIGFKGPECG